ncbi:MAG: bifunctional oligoribonuclease/PAP phosphatase NrnA [Planctomycetales bacterium]|nr:bifunctional oligoribonuclease/PAP phosphatase NrnA [Planctomycetales bacterium]
MSLDWNLLSERIQRCQSFVLCSHIRPDCDALGSELGMAGILQQLGKKVRIINGHPTPPSLSFIDPAQKIEVIGESVRPEEVNGDCIIVLDTSAWAQLGPMGEVLRNFKGVKLCIDHHMGEDELGTEFFKDTSAEATGHLVAKLAKQLQVTMTRTMAKSLYAAIATDTGWFRFGSTTSETYRLVAELVEAGAVPSEIYGDLYERDTIGRVRLRGRILSRTQDELGGTLVYTHVLKEDFSETGAIASDTEDAINLTLAIAGTKVAVIFVEQLKGGFKLSFRSRCGVDCNKVAGEFGGGGHKAAAGAFVQGTLKEVQAQVLPVVREAMQIALGALSPSAARPES